MTLIEDTRNQKGKHEIKHAAWAQMGDTLVRCALPCGDYALPPKVAVDTKANMAEIANNVGVPSDHKRFRRELQRAQDMGTHLYVLIENDEGIKCVEDVARWVNPRLEWSPKAIDGKRLCRAMLTMQERYGVTFLFCKPSDAAKTINKILERGK